MSPRDAAADWARQAHAPRDAARERTDDLNVFARNVDGAAEPAAPLNRGRSSGGGEPASVVILPGHHLALEASAGHALDGTAVEFDTVVRDDGWGVTLGTGKSTFTFPSTACFDFGDLEVEFDEAAEWAGTVTVTVKVNGEARWSASGYANDNGISWSSGMLGAVVEGDTWSLHVDAPDAPSPSVVRVKMQRVERQAPEVPEHEPYAFEVAEGSVTVDMPSNMEVGDLLVAFVWSHEPTISGPGGWTQQDITTLDGGDRRAALYTRVAEDGDTSATWSVSGGVDSTSVAVMIAAIKGGTTVEDTDNEFFEASQNADSQQVTVTPASSSSQLVVMSGTVVNAGTSHDHDPTVYRKRYDAADIDAVGTVSLWVEDLSSTDPKSHTVNYSMTVNTAGTIALVVA